MPGIHGVCPLFEGCQKPPLTSLSHFFHLPDYRLERVLNLCSRPCRMKRGGYPSDVSDEEWTFVMSYLCLISLEAPQRSYDLREVFNAVRYLVRSGAPWRLLPNDLPPWHIVYQQTQRWLGAGCFEHMAHDLRAVLRMTHGRNSPPSAAILNSRTLQGTPESASHSGYDGYKKKKGSTVHLAVDASGHLLALTVTPANQGDRTQVQTLCQQVQEVTGHNIQLAYVDQGYSGDDAAQAAQQQGVQLEVVKSSEAKRGFVLLPKRWVVERSFAWATRFRRLAKDYERLPHTVAGLHFIAFACLMLAQLKPLLTD